jgi:hypothetical protein
MKPALYAVYITLAVVIALVLILVVGDDGQDEGDERLPVERRIELVLDAFGTPSCEDAQLVGSVRVTRPGGGRERILAFEAGEPCLADLRAAALGRGFTDDGSGRLSFEDGARRRETLLFYAEGGAFEWEVEEQ